MSKLLEKSSFIKIVSPAGNVESEFVYQAKSRLELAGFNVEISPNALSKYHKFASNDINRLADLQNAIDDKDVDVILCARGGYGCMRIVDKLDFTSLIDKQKMLIGFSDITVLHAAMAKNGLQSIHGPMCKDIATGSDDVFNSLMRLIKNAESQLLLPEHSLNKSGQAQGVLLGGNLSLLYALQGTAYDLPWDKAILFIEDLSEQLYHLDRMMQNLRLSGKLKNLSALIVGQFTNMQGSDFGLTAYEIINDAVADYNFPVYYNAPIGHVENNYPLIHNAFYQIKDNKLILKDNNLV